MPVIEALAEEFAGRVRFVKVDVDPEGDLLEAFDSKGVPTYLVFRHGVEVERLAPLLFDWGTERRLRSRIEDALAATPTTTPGS
ncbi:MAG: thioredoxin family protein [Deltaproteobacteria bacterium]|nr:thioredoxin family protein [Deltaproteobacteria bacterium]